MRIDLVLALIALIREHHFYLLLHCLHLCLLVGHKLTQPFNLLARGPTCDLTALILDRL
jgi:hypothetical protein